jgi:hypothetical protein
MSRAYLEPQEMPPTVWSVSDLPEQPRLSVTLPSTGQFVWLCGRRPFSDPAAVRRWSIAAVDPDGWSLHFGVAAVDSKEAVRRTRSSDSKPTGGVMMASDTGLQDHTSTPPTPIGRMDLCRNCFALTFEVDVDANTGSAGHSAAVRHRPLRPTGDLGGGCGAGASNRRAADRVDGLSCAADRQTARHCRPVALCAAGRVVWWRLLYHLRRACPCTVV